MSAPHSTAVVMLCLDRAGDTLSCLESLRRAPVAPNLIILCDNGSSPDSQNAILAWATKHFESGRIVQLRKGQATPVHGDAAFVFIRNQANLGFAAGNNPGIDYALRAGADFIWLLNNDTTVEPDALAQLLLCAGQGKAGILGSTVVHADGSNVVQCAGGCVYQPLTTVFKPLAAGLPLATVLRQDILFRPPDYIYGASLFVRRAVFEQCGLLNEDYFLFYEEIDFCRRAREAGFGMAWCRASVVYHQGSSTVGRPDSGDRKKIALANYHENLSTLLFTGRHFPQLLPVTLIFRFFGKIAMLARRRGEWYLVRPLVAAYLDFFRGRNQREKYGPEE